MRMNWLGGLVLCLPIAFSSPAIAQTASIIPTEGAVRYVVATSSGGFIETARGSFRLDPCTSHDSGVCATADVIRGLPDRAPEGALPDGSVATSSKGDIRKAWYGRPTDRYQHCVLGDCLEGGSLVVETADGKRLEFVLPDNQVFEDITPRIFDFGGDGRNEVVAIRASRAGGGGVIVYGIDGGQLKQVAQSTENGRPNRWLNIAGIGADTIHFVRTPHIGGRLFTLSRNADGRWQEKDRSDVGRLSNHLIGSRELGLSYLGASPFGSGSILALPVQTRDTLWIAGGSIETIALPGRIDKAIIRVGNALVTATDDGRLIAIHP